MTSFTYCAKDANDPQAPVIANHREALCLNKLCTEAYLLGQLGNNYGHAHSVELLIVLFTHKRHYEQEY